MSDINNQDSVIVKDDASVGSKTKSVPVPQHRVDIDSDKKFLDNITDAAINSQLDLSTLNSFSTVSQSRENIYNLIDNMCEDPTIAAALETYAEDATEYNENGDIIWVTSNDANISKFVGYLLQTMNVNKHAYEWVYNLCKYGDLYLQLFRESEFDQDPFFGNQDDDNKLKDLTRNERKKLNEDIKIKGYSKNDKLVHYVEAVPNAAKMFELTRFGKTYGFIEADVTQYKTNAEKFNNDFFRYKFSKKDVIIYDATKFVHASLTDNSNRHPEEVNLYIEGKNGKEENNITYKSKRGQSLFQSIFKIWRELSLLENSMLLNRITKSSIIRLINVEVGDMPKEEVGPHLQGLKSLFEQKAAINTGDSMKEYTNPGPVENNIYIPTRNGMGNVTTGQVGGDFNVSQIPDVEYFQNKFFGALRIPKQYFGLTDDAAGFSGGESLAIISSRYAKMVKRIQNALIQALTSAINIILIDRGLQNYVGKFTIKMQPPTTKEEIDRRDNLQSRVQIVSDVMNLLSDVEDPAIKLKILKSLVSQVINDDEIINLIEAQIEKTETEGGENEPNEKTKNEDDLLGGSHNDGFDSDFDNSLDLDKELNLDDIDNEESSLDNDTELDNSNNEGESETLPNPSDLGIDFTDNNSNEF